MQVGTLRRNPHEFDRSLACISAVDGSAHLVVADGQLAALECGRPAGSWVCLQSQLLRGENPFDRNRGILAGPDLTGHFVTGQLQRRFAGYLAVGRRDRDCPVSGHIGCFGCSPGGQHQESSDNHESRCHCLPPFDFSFPRRLRAGNGHRALRAVGVFNNALTVAETSAGTFDVQDGHDGESDRHNKGFHYKNTSPWTQG
jgi:hypothetical protein